MFPISIEYFFKILIIFDDSFLSLIEIPNGEFAKRININPGTLSAIVNNRQLPSFDVVYAICKELNKPIDEIWIKNSLLKASRLFLLF
ncbi:helix-turn-helix transcriptional regulator [Thermaerobacillus caldiproteolyticus]|uniref:helix-turn-helix transcriptional regulator n=1 Tax=Thermaerobacillus caldiproteolyticus TaxID=247480 RepID=UPI001F19AC37|nr:helix-turn-helix transcriptional regulator [Anoxybacillus caldiproteolyticus]